MTSIAGSPKVSLFHRDALARRKSNCHRSLARCRRLLCEPLEERRLLAASYHWEYFRTDEGGGLDVYTDGSISFDIDIGQINLEDIQAAELQLNVYDVDYACESYFDGPCERDYVYVNGDMVGYLTGANNSWSTCNFIVDPASLRQGMNTIFIDIDVLSRQNWLVECDYGELALQVPDVIEDVEVRDEDGSYSVPVTMEQVYLEAKVRADLSPDIRLRNVRWEIWDVTPGRVATRQYDEVRSLADVPLTPENLSLKYTPAANAHGLKEVRCDFTFVDLETDMTFSDEFRKEFELFFRHFEDDDGDNEPNWYDYWIQDAAVHKLSIFSYGGLGGNTLAQYEPNNDQLWVFSGAGSGYPGESIPLRSGGSLGVSGGIGVNTIDGVARILEHELNHQQISREVRGLPDTDFLLPYITRNEFAEGLGYQLGSAEELEYLESLPPYAIRRVGDHVADTREDDRVTSPHFSDTWGFPDARLHGMSHDYEYRGYNAQNVSTAGLITRERDWSHLLGRRAGSASSRAADSSLAALSAEYSVITLPSDNTFGMSTPYRTVSADLQAAQRTMLGLAGVYSEIPEDTDGDSRFNTLIVLADVNVPVEGNYLVSGSLWDHEQSLVGDLAETIHMTQGVQTLRLAFKGERIHSQAADGPLQLDLLFIDDNGVFVDGGIGIYTTQSYQPQQFDSYVEASVLAEQAIDSNGNGLYDALMISSDLDALSPGTYFVNAILTDSSGVVAGEYGEWLSLSAGRNVVPLSFHGSRIQDAKSDGPYVLSLFVSTGSDAVLMKKPNVYQTSAYSHTQFEGQQAALSDAYSDYGKDTDGDGTFDLLSIDVGINVNLEGDYRLTGYLYDDAGNYVDYASSEVHLAPGARSVTLDCESLFLASSGYTGAYKLGDLYLVDTNGTELDYRTHAYTTNPYGPGEFDALEASFNGVYSDAGVDSDSDSLYNRLDVMVGVDVTNAGDYSLSGAVYDAQGIFITDVIGMGHLGLGSHTLSVSVAGSLIVTAEADGPYQLRHLTLRDESGSLVAVGNAYETAEYSHLDFDAPSVQFSGTISDHLVDSNQDGSAESLAVTYEVIASEAGSYNLNGRLATPSGKLINWASTVATLAANMPTLLTLQFSGIDILNSCHQGTFIVDSVSVYNLSDHSIQAVWRDPYETAEYFASEFLDGTSQFPVADGGGPYVGVVGQAVAFDSSGSYDPDGSIVEYRWDFDMDGACDIISTTPYAEHTWDAPFSGLIRMRVTDDTGLISYSTAQVSINVFTDTERPRAVIADPSNGARIFDRDLNARGYLDVTFTDPGDSGLDPATILDADPELTLSGMGVGNVMLNGAPQLVPGTETTYRYTFSGSFQPGTVSVDVLAGSFADGAGNTNVAAEIGTFETLACVWIEDLAVVEGSHRSGKAAFQVTLSAPSTKVVTVRYATANGTARAGTDFSKVRGIVKFRPGETTKTILVGIKADKLDEEDESFRLLVGSIGMPIGRRVAMATIVDDDLPPVASIADVYVKERDSGTRTADFAVSLSGASGKAVTISYATADGSATVADNDYLASTGTVVFRPGEVTKTIRVPVVGDRRYESNEAFQVDLSAQENTTLGRATGTGRIRNDDEMPNLSVADVRIVEPLQGSTEALFMVSLSAASGLPVTVNYVTTNGTAAASKDYAASSGVLRFEPGETTKAISVAVLADTFMERNETFRMKLNGLQGAEFGRSKATCTIQDAALAALLSESSAIHTPDRNTRTASAVDYALLWLVMSD